MLRGLVTVNHYADDLAAAQSWYTELLGAEPYFARGVDGKPAYIEFRIGDYQHELGVIDSRFAARGPVPNTMTYWHVDDVTAAYQCLLDLGARHTAFFQDLVPTHFEGAFRPATARPAAGVPRCG